MVSEKSAPPLAVGSNRPKRIPENSTGSGVPKRGGLLDLVGGYFWFLPLWVVKVPSEMKSPTVFSCFCCFFVVGLFLFLVCCLCHLLFDVGLVVC